MGSATLQLVMPFALLPLPHGSFLVCVFHGSCLATKATSNRCPVWLACRSLGLRLTCFICHPRQLAGLAIKAVASCSSLRAVMVVAKKKQQHTPALRFYIWQPPQLVPHCS